MAAIKIEVDVSEDLVMDILTCLPVKSLLRLRCVCRRWCDLIANPDFITKHHLKQTTLNKKWGNFFLNNTQENFHSSPMISIVKDYNITKTIYLPFAPSCCPYILGPRNGLLCITHRECDVYGIWNPATRELKITSESPVDHLPDYCESRYGGIGFGFDHKTNDYKVVQFVKHTFNGWRDHVKEVNIYSLRSESWRKIPPLLGGKVWPDWNRDNVYHDGVHYFWCLGETFEGQCLMSFDMADEVFKMLPLIPNWIDFGFNVRFLVTIYNGSLSLLVYTWDGPEKFLDIWVMTEIIGGNDSWVKQISIGPILGINYPLGLSDKGEWVSLADEGNLLLYDPKTKQLMKVSGLNWRNHSLQVIKYEESLVSIKGIRISKYYEPHRGLDKNLLEY